MKAKIVSFGLLLSVIAASGYAGSDHYITVPENLKPTVAVDQAQLNAIEKEMATLGNIGVVEADTSWLTDPSDKVVAQQATQVIANHLIDVSKKIVDLKILLRQAAAAYGGSVQLAPESITLALKRQYTPLIQNAYKAILKELAKIATDVDQTMLENCRSKACVAALSEAADDFIDLFESMNNSTTASGLVKLTGPISFKSKFAKTAIEMTFNELSQVNTSDSNLIRSALGPVVQAARARTDVPQLIGKAIGASVVLPFSVKLSEVNKDPDLMRENNKDDAYDTLYRIVVGTPSPGRPKHLVAMKCQMRTNSSGGGLVFDYGPAYMCEDIRNAKTYAVRIKTIGVVATAHLQAEDLARMWILIVSPFKEMTPVGRWVGLKAEAGVLVGVGAADYTGNYGAKAEVVIAGITTMGVSVGFSWMNIAPSYEALQSQSQQ